MGRIRKLAAWTLSPGGNLNGLVRAESSAERAARDQAELMKQQNELLAQLARNQQPGQPPAPVPHAALVCCVDCINQGCDQTMIGQVGLTRAAAQCDCRVHYPRS